jgi:HD-like signal output (HDOD) protein
MRAECPGCKALIELPGEGVVGEGRGVDAHCPHCRSAVTVGVVAVRAAAAAAPAAASGPPAPGGKEDPPAGQLSPALKSHILRSLVNLPAMPMVILKARGVMADPNAGLRDLARIIENDQALVGRALSIANSAYYGLGGQVSTLGHAAVLLGLETLGTIIVTAAAASLLNRDLKSYGLDPRTLWRHSLAAALGARRLADLRHPELREDAFVAGLLHDAGKIILDPYLDASRVAAAAPGLTLAAEREILGCDHAEIMARACRFWRFPEAVVQAVRHHHQPSQASGAPLAHIAHLANALAHRAGLGASAAPGAALEEEEESREALGLRPEDLAEAALETLGEVEKTEQVLAAA